MWILLNVIKLNIKYDPSKSNYSTFSIPSPRFQMINRNQSLQQLSEAK